MVDMSIELSIIVFLAGTVVCGLLGRLLRRSATEAVTTGVTTALLWLTSYPLIGWLTDGSGFSLATLLITMAVAGITAGGIAALMTRSNREH
jgi:asparagine N-glycosylation enzyme membrane subunit Stt3